MVEGHFSGRKKVAPAIGGKGDMSGRKHRQEVILPCADGSLRLVDAVVVRRDTMV